MKNRFLSNLLKAALVAAYVMAPNISSADDTDIYVNSNNNSGAAPLVMFTIDVRSSTGSTFQCTSNSAPTVDQPTGGCLYYFKHKLASGCEFMNGGSFTELDGSTVNCPANSAPISAIGDLYEFLRLSLKVALYAFEDKGLNIGLMINHDHKNNCAGPANATALNCANGGMITMGFTTLSADSGNHYALNRLNDQLRGIKVFATDTNGSAGKHSYQGSELFFEFFRYLTGLGNDCGGTDCGRIYNGHNGGLDWGGQISQSSGSYGPRKVLGVPAGATEKGNHCGPNTAPGTYTGGSDPTVINGSNPNKYKDDGACWDNSTTPLPSAVAAVENAGHTHYISPLSGVNTCGRIFTINFINGQVNQDTDSNTEIARLTTDGGMGFNPGTNGANLVVGALHQMNLRNPPTYAGDPSGNGSVTSYFLSTGQAGPEVPGIATAGGTSAIDLNPADFASDPDKFVREFEKIFTQILSVSTTFVASAIPANVFNRAQSLNDVYIALFQPDVNNNPFWVGNVKKLKIAKNSSGDLLVDSRNVFAVNPVDGRIDSSAVTFWTDVANLNATQFNPNTQAPATGWRTGNATATSDGRQVNRGGAGEIIPGYVPSATASPKLTNATAGARQVFYDDPAGGTALLPLNANNSLVGTAEVQLCANGGPLGLTGPADARCQKLLKYMRGIDVSALLNPNNLARSWMMGDPLHSRPLPINYGIAAGHASQSNPAIYIAVTGNDGALHFIENTLGNGTQSGKEIWSFIPRLAMGIQEQLMDNSTAPHPYGLDGSPVAYLNDGGDSSISGGSDKAIIYVTMRRGGRAIYALDVTSPTAPTLLWKKASTDTGYADLGMTFSNPKVGRVAIGNVTKPALFFAGGYAGGPGGLYKDADAIGNDNDPFGKAIYVVDALNGDILWKVVGNTAGGTTGPMSSSPCASNCSYRHMELRDSIPSEVSIGDTDGDGLTDRLVVGDTGGNVWRADFKGADASKWSVIRLANLGRHDAANTGAAGDRRFFNAPKIVQTKDASGVKYDAVVIGSGDRENPLDAGAQVAINYFYNIRDNNTDILGVDPVTNAIPADVNRLNIDLADVTNDCLQTGTQASCGQNLQYGWKLQLTGSPSPHSEKNLASALVISNVVYFTTYLPPGSAAGCSPSEGTGRLYAVALLDATAVKDYRTACSGACDRSTDLASSGIPAGVVYIAGNSDVDAGILKPSLDIEPPTGVTRIRSFWQRVEDIPP